jgi:chromosome segregation ATPase
MKEMEDKKKSVASVSVQTEEVEESNSNSKFDEYESLVASLKEENEGKDVQMLQLQQELADSMSAKNAELSKLAKEYREQDEKVSELSHACATLADALESAEDEVEMLKERVKGGGEIEMKMESLKEALTERTHELNIAQSEKTEWEQKCEDLQSEMLFKVAALETLKQSFAELEANEKEVENMESRNGLLADEVEIFEHLFEEEKQKKIDLISKYNEEKEDMLEMINHLGNDMKKYECEAFTWWTKAELENTRAADLEDEIERLQDELERVNEEQDERTELLLDVAKLKEEKRAVDEALEKVDTTNKTLNVRLKKSYERIQELDKEIESANSDRDFLRKEVDEANSRVKVLEAWCKETKVHGEIDDGDDDDTNISDSYDYAKIPARYEELKLENIELMEKLTASKAVEESLSQRLENTMHETDGLKDEAKTALMKSSEMQKMTENAVEKTAQMTSELEEATNEIQKLENLLTVSRRQVQTLEKQLAAPRGEIHQEAEMHPIYENEEDTSAIKEYFEAQNEELTALLASKTSELTQMQA